MDIDQLSLIDADDFLGWKEHWKDMPEYNNVSQPDPAITATFRFRNEKDFKHFEKVIKEHLYKGERVFDGMQKKEAKSAWYPLKEKASKYYYDEK